MVRQRQINTDATVKRKGKEFPSEPAHVTDENRCVTYENTSNVGTALEIDSNPKRKNFGANFLDDKTFYRNWDRQQWFGLKR